MKPRSSRAAARIHYKNHLEAVWCVEGDGSIQTIADGKTLRSNRAWSMPERA